MTTRREILKSGAAALAESALFPAMGASSSKPGDALYWHPFGDAVVCELCPHKCVLKEKDIGRCRTRQNIKGALVTHAYANPCALHADPIEKKPFFHFLPATRAYSIGVAGCNLRCLNCQNYTISQHSPDETDTQYLPPEKAVNEAVSQGCSSIAYTYSEPIVWFEYMLDVAKRARASGLKNIMVTAGFINEAPLRELSKYMDAITLDIKSFSDPLYRKLNAGALKPVLNTLVTAQKCKTWVEISNLIVPGWTDDMTMISKLCVWIKQNMGSDIPLHFLRFFPLYKLADLYPTPVETLKNAQKIAREEGLNYTYVGNVAEIDSNTYCPSCKKPLIVRDGYLIRENSIKKSICPYCKKNINGIWTI
jgi:pyruvate formate lyase activating enzyme